MIVQSLGLKTRLNVIQMKEHNPARGGGGVVLDISLGGEVRLAPHTLTPFKTNIADFPTLFKTEFRVLIPCLRHLTRILINKSL